MKQKKAAKRVLVVDDEKLNCDMLEEFLSSQGYDVSVALNGSEALKTSRRERPHLVLLDVNMPGKSGLETLKELKTIVPESPVIMFSGLRDKVLAKQAQADGAAAYITKPIHLGRLLELISGLL